MKEFSYEKYAKITWDNEILSLVSHIHEYKGKQQTLLKQKPLVLDRLAKIAKIQSVTASNKMEGIVTTDARIKQLCDEKTIPKNRDEQEIDGYKLALKTIHENYKIIPIERNYILQLHAILYSLTTLTIGGRFKGTKNYIRETDSDGNTFIRFEPLEPFQVPEAIDSICENYIREIDNSVIDPLLLIPIFILDFLCIHPFNDGNGRMSRLLTTLLLYQSGYYIGRYISLEKIIEQTKEGYYDALSASSKKWHENNNDPNPFIKYLLKIIYAAYRDFDNRLNIIESKASAIEIVRKAVETKIGKFTRTDIGELCPSLERSSIAAALKKLVEEGVLNRKGTGKSIYYYRTK